MSKGDNPRTWNTPEFESNYERIFGKKEPYYARSKSKDAAYLSSSTTSSSCGAGEQEQPASEVSAPTVPSDEKGVE